jgi:hypothetical protein
VVLPHKAEAAAETHHPKANIFCRRRADRKSRPKIPQMYGIFDRYDPIAIGKGLRMGTPSSPQQQVTQLLVDWSSGDTAALEKLIPLVQPELHRLASAAMWGSRKRYDFNHRITSWLVAF